MAEKPPPIWCHRGGRSLWPVLQQVPHCLWAESSGADHQITVNTNYNHETSLDDGISDWTRAALSPAGSSVGVPRCPSRCSVLEVHCSLTGSEVATLLPRRLAAGLTQLKLREPFNIVAKLCHYNDTRCRLSSYKRTIQTLLKWNQNLIHFVWLH